MMESRFRYSPESHPPIWTVGEVTSYILQMFELDYRLQDISIEGEISNFSRSSAGHLYFTLKDSASQIKCAMWRSNAERLRFRPADGDAIIAHGKVSVYETGGVYQFYVDRIQPAGRGDLATTFQLLKEKLAAEGLFDAERKQPLPATPHKIGIVTSATGAAVQDILTALQRRNPLLSVLIVPTLVQGDLAPPQIVRALQWLDDRDDIDTIILARGGGSIEDLWAFNDERVARAIAAARHPIICGVGHETDFTIADFVADLRAPTPTAAAELVAPDIVALRPILATMDETLRELIDGYITMLRETVRAKVQVLGLLSPERMLNRDRQLVDSLADRLERATRQILERRQSLVNLAARELAAVSPAATLARGFAIVRDEQQRVIRLVGDVAAGQRLTIQVSDGEFGAEVTS